MATIWPYRQRWQYLICYKTLSCPVDPNPREYSYFPDSVFPASPIKPKSCDKSCWSIIFGRKLKVILAASQDISKQPLSELRTQEVFESFSCQHFGHVVSAVFSKNKMNHSRNPHEFRNQSVNPYGHGGDKRPSIFRIALENYLTLIPIDKGFET